MSLPTLLHSERSWTLARILAAWLCWPLLAGAQPPAAGTALSGQDALTRVRVVEVTDPGAMVAFDPQSDRVRAMVNAGIKLLTLKDTPAEAWRSLVSTQDIVGLKVFTLPGAVSGTRPAVAAAVVQGLLDAGLAPQHIIVWDKRLADLRRAGYLELARKYKIRVAGGEDTGYDDKNFYDSSILGDLIWGDHEFGKKGEKVGRKSFVSKLVTEQMTKIISLPPLLNHNKVGVTGNLYNVAIGSVDNTLRFEVDAKRMATAVPELYALPVLGDRVVLNIVDALICQYQGEHDSLLQYSTILNQLRFGTDPVALDILSIRELEKQRQAAKIPLEKPDMKLYENAAALLLGVADERRIQVEPIQ